MPSIVRCSECQKHLRIQDEMLGKKIRCPGCQAVIAAPLPEEPLLAEVMDQDNAVTADEPRRRDGTSVRP